jgi:hypothetical protein
MKVCSFAAMFVLILGIGANSWTDTGLAQDNISKGSPQGRWTAPSDPLRDVTLAEQWLSYWAGSGSLVWWEGPERAVRFDPNQFGGVNYPLWIKKVRSSFFEDSVPNPWDACSLFTYKIYADDGTTLLHESDTLAPSSRDGTVPTEWNLGVDSVEITSGTFWVSVSPLCDSYPSSLADSTFLGRTRYGSPGSWVQFLSGELSTEAFVGWTDLTHDVSLTSILLPGFGAWVDSTNRVRVRVKNNGADSEDVDVECMITVPIDSVVADTEYIDTFYLLALPPDSTRTLTFGANWIPAVYDTAYLVRARTMLPTDEDSTNNEGTKTTRTYEFGEIAYDDFEQDDWWIPTPPPNGPGDAFAQRLSPYLTPPFVVTKFKIYVDSIQPFDNVRLCPSLTPSSPDFDNPYDIIPAPCAVSPPEWIVLEFDTLNTHITTSDPVWLCAQFEDGAVGPGIGSDEDGPFNLNSYWTDDLSSWNLFGEDLFMRIVHKQTLPGVAEGKRTRDFADARLFQNAPNPFMGTTTVEFIFPRPAYASLKVYDIAGNAVRTLLSGRFGDGLHAVVWDGKDDAGKDLAAGFYFCKLDGGGFNATKKMILLR